MQEEQRVGIRVAEASSKSESKALMSNCNGKCAHCNVATNTRTKCGHCGKLGHPDEKCWKKFPHLNPHKQNKRTETGPAFIVNHGKEDLNVICLVGRSSELESPFNRNEWVIDSGCSNHMSLDRSLFSDLSKPHLENVKLGNGAKASIVGCGSIEIDILLNGKSVRARLDNFLLVPELG